MPRSAVGAVLVLRGVAKAFGAVQALEGVDLEIRGGEVHGLIGENGAGKSTLMKILSGAHAADSGDIMLDGAPYRPADPAAARRAGIAMIYQELSLAPHLSVAENITLGVESSRAGFLVARRDRILASLSSVGHDDLDPGALAGELPVGIQQVVEIARALYMDARVVIMDEPTSSLSTRDAGRLFDVIAKLKARGLAVVYISHFLEEIQRACDRYTVLRDGRSVASGTVAGVSQDELVQHMIGRSTGDIYRRIPHDIGEELLSVEGLEGLPVPDGVTFSLRRGEIMGLAGLVGAGRSETLRSLFGLLSAKFGTARLLGKPVELSLANPGRMLALGMNMLSEDRKGEGLALGMSVAANVTLSCAGRYARCGLFSPSAEAAGASAACARLAVRSAGVNAPVASLSGGNQQKVALARLLHHDSDILLLDEPTRGIDVGSKADLYELIQRLAESGKAVVMASSYLPELLGVCDTIAVMHRGRMSPKRPASEWTAHGIMTMAASGWEEEVMS